MLRTYSTSLNTHYALLGLACLGIDFFSISAYAFYLYSSIDLLSSSTYIYIISLYAGPNIIMSLLRILPGEEN